MEFDAGEGHGSRVEHCFGSLLQATSDMGMGPGQHLMALMDVVPEQQWISGYISMYIRWDIWTEVYIASIGL